MMILTSLIVFAAVANAHVPPGFTPLPLNPLLGVPGFPDCVKASGGNVTGDPELALLCDARPKLRADQISIACMGDSITAGVHSSGRNWTYPSQLQHMLDAKYPGKYVVTNYGACGSTMQKTGDSPYWKRPQYPAVMKSNADIIVIMLGTNDAKDTGNHGPANWENDGHTGVVPFTNSFHSMIDEFKAFASKPVIYSAIPPPLYKDSVYGMNQTVINDVFPVLIPHINAINQLPHAAIDVFDALGGAALKHPGWTADGCHPNDVGYTHLAAAVMAGIGL